LVIEFWLDPLRVVVSEHNTGWICTRVLYEWYCFTWEHAHSHGSTWQPSQVRMLSDKYPEYCLFFVIFIIFDSFTSLSKSNSRGRKLMHYTY